MIWKVLSYPRYKLITLPTPFEKSTTLGRELGLELYFKRDDVMELGLGGNKARKLEFILADAIEKNCDVLVITGPTLSNCVRLTAAAARKAGLDVYAVITPPGHPELKGNMLLNMIYGVKHTFVDSKEKAETAVEEISRNLRSMGRKPYIIPEGAASEIGTLGYVLAGFEIMDQCLKMNFKPKYIVHSTSTGATQAGLVLGLRLLGIKDVEVIGIADGTPLKEIASKAEELYNSAARLLGSDLKIKAEDFVIYEEYGFGGYGVISKEIIETIVHVARKEGILLDPVYTGKAIHGLIDLAYKNEIRGNTVFIHTGGTPLIFHHEEYFANYREKTPE